MNGFIQILKGEEENSGYEAPSLCPYCAHRESIYTCKAFPDGIPVDILMGIWDHQLPHEGDSGITFERRYEDTIEKGEGPGHPFRGNQYTKGISGSGAWNKIGSQKGSNPGGVFEHNGVKHYVKFPNSEGQVDVEVASDKIHALMGVGTMGHQAIAINGKKASVSKLQEITELGEKGWRSMTPEQEQDAANIFMASALTKNWDVVGLEYDNMGTTKDGKLAIIDTGGSFQFRAQGAPKEFGPDADVEVRNMLSKEKTSGRVFAPLLARNPKVFYRAAKRLSTLSKNDLEASVAGMPASKAVTSILLQRQKAITRLFL